MSAVAEAFSGKVELYYDFHLHSCLSPCGDADMTPNNIVNMAKLKGLDAIALTDHNACGNCAAAMEAGEREGVIVLPGMELCTAEDIHVVCIFPKLSFALEFEKEIRKTLPKIKNRPDIFGEQLILDGGDRVVGREETLLITASGIGIDGVFALCRGFGGTAFPAHADKQANGIVGVLGAIPPEVGFAAVELSPRCDAEDFSAKNPSLGSRRILRDSDAHYLWEISERTNSIAVASAAREAVVAAVDGR